MAPRRLPADHLSVRDVNPPGGVFHVIERPAEDDLPEVIRILSDDEVGEVQVVDVRAADFIPLVFSDDEDEFEAEEDLESEDSGYSSLSEEEEEEEDEMDVDDDIFRPGWRYFPVPSPERPAQPVEHPEDLPPVSPRSEDSAPPASGLNSSTKRSREDSDTPPVSMKRQRKTCEDYDEEPRPSTSGTSSSMPRRYWPSSFQYLRRPDDSDSDED